MIGVRELSVTFILAFSVLCWTANCEKIPTENITVPEGDNVSLASVAQTRSRTATNTWKYFEDGSGTGNDYTNNLDITWEIRPTDSQCFVKVQFEYIHLQEGKDFIYLSNTRDDFGYDTAEVGPLYSSVSNLFIVRFTSDGNIVDHGFRAIYKQSCGAAPDVHNYRLLTATNSWKTLSVGYERLAHLFWRIHTLNAECQVLGVLTKVANPQVEFCSYECSDLDFDYSVTAVSDHFHSYPEKDLYVRYKTSGSFPPIPGGFALQYIQHCPSSPTFVNGYWRFNVVKKATASWQTLSDPGAGVLHTYQNEEKAYFYQWLLLKTHDECRVAIEFTLIRHDILDITDIDSFEVFKVNNENGEINTNVAYISQLEDGSIYISIGFKVDTHPKSLTFKFIEDCSLPE
jgi:hypothetical protein